MGRRWFDDLTGDDLADDNVHTLAITLDGDPLKAYDVAARPADELLAALRDHLVESIAARIAPDEPLDPGPLDEPGPAVDESAEDQPSTAQPIEVPGVVVVTEPPAAAEPQQVGEADRGRASDATVRRWAASHGIPCSTTGGLKAWVRDAYERVGGQVPDFEARRRARTAGADPTTPSVRPEVAGALTIATWCLRNGVEDKGGNVTVAGRQAYAAAWRAAHPDEKPPAAGVSPTGEDPPAPDGRAGQAAASGAGVVNGHRPRAEAIAPTDNAPPAAVVSPADPEGAAGSDLDGADGSTVSAGSDPAAAKPASVRPTVEPIGDGTGQPASRPEQLERADELAVEGKTPRQISSETGVWLSEARAAVRKASQR